MSGFNFLIQFPPHPSPLNVRTPGSGFKPKRQVTTSSLEVVSSAVESMRPDRLQCGPISSVDIWLPKRLAVNPAGAGCRHP